MIYTVNADPVPWMRAGLNKTNRFYDQQVQSKIAFGLIVAKQHKNKEPHSKPISLDLQFHIKQPKSRKEIIPMGVKPDLDNLIKFVLDALNDVLWIDDKIITTIHAHKQYSHEPKTIITIKEIQ